MKTLVLPFSVRQEWVQGGFCLQCEGGRDVILLLSQQLENTAETVLEIGMRGFTVPAGLVRLLRSGVRRIF